MRYVLKKIGMLILTILLMSLVVFVAFRLIPGDPALTILGGQSDPEAVEALRQRMGLNDPILVQYGRWLSDFIKGDMGTSYRYSVPVSQLIMNKFPVTLALALYAFVLMMLIAIPLGIYTAKHAGSLPDHLITVGGQIMMAVPPFFSGILITWIFGLILHVFTPGGYVPFRQDPAGFLIFMLFPAMAIALPRSAMLVKLLRSSVLTESTLDYVRTAYSRGNTTNAVLYHHVLKNAILPVVTFLGMTLADVIAGSLIIEQVFGIPGLCKTLLTSISNRDYPVVTSIIVLIAVIVVVSNVIVDILYTRLDPRIRLK